MNKIASVSIADAMPIAPDLRAHPDAELFELVEQFIIAERKYRELMLAVDRMEERPRDPMPNVLRWRPNDKKLGLPPLHVCAALPKPNWDAPVQVDRVRGNRWIFWTRVPVKGHPTKGMFQDLMRLVKPSKAARVRADEIIAAYDEWVKPGVLPRGHKKLVKERDKADRFASRLENQIYETRATTIDGMLAKVRVGHASLFCEPHEIDDIELDQMSRCADRMADSIFRDLQRLAIEKAADLLDPKLVPAAVAYVKNLKALSQA